MEIGEFQSLGSLAGKAGHVKSAAMLRNGDGTGPGDELKHYAQQALESKGKQEWNKLRHHVTESDVFHNDDMANIAEEEKIVEREDAESDARGDNYDFHDDTSGVNAMFAEMLAAAPKRHLSIGQGVANVTKADSERKKKLGVVGKLSSNIDGGHNNGFAALVRQVVTDLDEETVLTRFVGKLGKAGQLVNATMTWQGALQRIHMTITTMINPEEFHFFLTRGDLKKCFEGYPDLQAASHRNQYLATALLKKMCIESMPLSETFALVAKPKYSDELARAARAINAVDTGEEEHIMVATIRRDRSEYEQRTGKQGDLQALAIGTTQMVALESAFTTDSKEALGINDFDAVLDGVSGAVK